MPVSPVEMCSELINLILSVKPEMKFAMLGGDQSGTWATASAMSNRKSSVGIIHFDAHSDCMEHIYGIKITGGSWLNHLSNELGSEKVVQLGVRDPIDTIHIELTMTKFK